MGDEDSAKGIDDQFVQKVISFYSIEIAKTSSRNKDDIEEQLKGLALLFKKKETIPPKNRAASNELKKLFSGNQPFMDFINELMDKSYGYHFEYSPVRDEKGNKTAKKDFFKKEVKVLHLPSSLNAFDLLRIAEQYTPPEVDFEHKSLFVNDSLLNMQAEFNQNPILTVFNHLFEQTAVCTKNKGMHSIATYQDAADPFSHRITVNAQSTDKDGVTSQSMLEARIIECEGNHSTKKSAKETPYLLVASLQGPVDQKCKEDISAYTYSCLIDYAYKAGKKLLFNVSFNPKSQNEPIEFMNFIARKIIGTDIYKFNEQEQKYSDFDENTINLLNNHIYSLKALTLENQSRYVKKIRKSLERALNGMFKNPKELFGKLAEEKRYADAWQPYEFRFKNNKEQPQWNMRDGETYCLELSLEDIEKEHKKLFPEQHRKKKRRTLIALAGAAAALAAGVTYLFSPSQVPPDNNLDNVVNNICSNKNCNPEEKERIKNRLLLGFDDRKLIEKSSFVWKADGSSLVDDCGYNNQETNKCDDKEYQVIKKKHDESLESIKEILKELCIDSYFDGLNLSCKIPVCMNISNRADKKTCERFEIVDVFKDVNLLDFKEFERVFYQYKSSSSSSLINMHGHELQNALIIHLGRKFVSAEKSFVGSDSFPEKLMITTDGVRVISPKPAVRRFLNEILDIMFNHEPRLNTYKFKMGQLLIEHHNNYASLKLMFDNKDSYISVGCEDFLEIFRKSKDYKAGILPFDLCKISNDSDKAVELFSWEEPSSDLYLLPKPDIDYTKYSGIVSIPFNIFSGQMINFLDFLNFSGDINNHPKERYAGRTIIKIIDQYLKEYTRCQYSDKSNLVGELSEDTFIQCIDQNHTDISESRKFKLDMIHDVTLDVSYRRNEKIRALVLNIHLKCPNILYPTKDSCKVKQYGLEGDFATQFNPALIRLVYYEDDNGIHTSESISKKSYVARNLVDALKVYIDSRKK